MSASIAVISSWASPSSTLVVAAVLVATLVLWLFGRVESSRPGTMVPLLVFLIVLAMGALWLMVTAFEPSMRKPT